MKEALKNSEDNNKLIIILKRKDLIESKKDILVQEMTLLDFKLTMEEIEKAKYISYVEDDIRKIFKEKN